MMNQYMDQPRLQWLIQYRLILQYPSKMFPKLQQKLMLYLYPMEQHNFQHFQHFLDYTIIYLPRLDTSIHYIPKHLVLSMINLRIRDHLHLFVPLAYLVTLRIRMTLLISGNSHHMNYYLIKQHPMIKRKFIEKHITNCKQSDHTMLMNYHFLTNNCNLQYFQQEGNMGRFVYLGFRLFFWQISNIIPNYYLYRVVDFLIVQLPNKEVKYYLPFEMIMVDQ